MSFRFALRLSDDAPRTAARRRLSDAHPVRPPGLRSRLATAPSLRRLWLGLRPGSRLGPIVACAYLATAALPLPLAWDVPLVALALAAVLPALSSLRQGRTTTSPLVLPVLLFLLATGLSLLGSEDPGRSMRLSAPLLPAALLFFVVADQFRGPRDVRFLYLTLSVVGLGLAGRLLWAAARTPDIAGMTGSPLFVVPNDVAFLATLAPLSLALLSREPRRLAGGVAALSILLGLGAVAMAQSRVAVLTLVVSAALTLALVRPRIALASALGLLLLVLLLDGLRGFPLLAKFAHPQHWDGSARIPLWLAAWAMFVDAPVLGHGPHTFVLGYRSYLAGLNLPTWLSTDPRVTPWPHNLYLEVLAEQGLVGLATLGVLVVLGLSRAWGTRRAHSPEVRALGAGAFGALGAFCLAGVFELSLLRLWVVLMLFTLLGVIAHLSRHNQTQEESPR